MSAEPRKPCSCFLFAQHLHFGNNHQSPLFNCPQLTPLGPANGLYYNHFSLFLHPYLTIVKVEQKPKHLVSEKRCAHKIIIVILKGLRHWTSTFPPLCFRGILSCVWAEINLKSDGNYDNDEFKTCLVLL